MFYYYSTAKSSSIKDRVLELFKHHQSCYGEFILTEFDDPFLKEHVVSVSVGDTESVSGDRQVFFLYHQSLYLISAEYASYSAKHSTSDYGIRLEYMYCSKKKTLHGVNS